MDDTTYHSPVVAVPYASVRTDLLPIPAVLTVDGSRLVMLTESSSGETLFQQPLSALKVQSRSQRNPLNAHRSAIIYVGPNEAYEITFLSGDPALDGGAQLYDKLLAGDLREATEQFKTSNFSTYTKEQRAQAQAKLHKNYDDFIAIATQAGIYKPARKSLSSLVSLLIVAVVVGMILWAFYKARH